MLVGGEGGGFIWMGNKWLPLIDGFNELPLPLPSILAQSRDLQERGVPLFEKGSVPQRPKKAPKSCGRIWWVVSGCFFWTARAR